MNQLSIQAFSGTINNQTTTLVNARDLHAHLGIKTAFSNWILRRIEDFGFIKNEDFIIIDPLAKNGKREKWGFQAGWGENKIDYHLTLDMAKELCMVERSEIGRQARRYFIEIEKEHREAMPEWALAQLSDAQAQLHAAREAVLLANPVLREVLRFTQMGLSLSEIGKLMDCSPSTADRYRGRLRAVGLLGHLKGASHTALDRNDAAQPSLIG